MYWLIQKGKVPIKTKASNVNLKMTSLLYLNLMLALSVEQLLFNPDKLCCGLTIYRAVQKPSNDLAKLINYLMESYSHKNWCRLRAYHYNNVG